MRKGKRTRPPVQSWLFALAIPAVALFMLFSLMPYATMVKAWPWGIGQQEVMAYQELFDRRPGQHVQGQAEKFNINSAGSGGAVVVAADGDTARATLSALSGNGLAEQTLVLAFPPEHLFRGMASMVLAPADLRSLDALYARAVADSLPLIAPGIRLVQMARDGGKPLPYLAQERITADYLLLHMPAATDLIAEDGPVGRPGTATKAVAATIGGMGKQQVHSSRFDPAATAALGLLACAESRRDLLGGASGALFDRITTRVEPLYGIQAGSGSVIEDGPLANAFEQALVLKATEDGILRLAGRLREDSAFWAGRFAAIDSAAVPVLARGRNIGLVQAEVDHRRTAFMQRLYHPQPGSFIGTAVEPQLPAAVGLDPWLTPFRTQKDTLRFVRGKYNIDHDLVIPKGMAVVLEKGTRWFMAPGVSVVVQGELHMRGTDLNPVFIRPQSDTAAYGAVAVNGTGATRVRIRGLRMSGGSGHAWNGIQFDGMLSFHLADVGMERCDINGSSGEASVSVRRGKLTMGDCRITDAANTALDLAECRAQVDGSSFAVTTGARSGQGIRAVGCRMIVRGCSFADLPGTAFGADRRSTVLCAGDQFTGNGVAVDMADGSLVHMDGCDLSGNAKVFVLRRKQPVLGGAVLKLYANTFAGNTVERDVDPFSKVESGATLDPRVAKEVLDKH